MLGELAAKLSRGAVWLYTAAAGSRGCSVSSPLREAVEIVTSINGLKFLPGAMSGGGSDRFGGFGRPPRYGSKDSALRFWNFRHRFR